MLKNNILIRKLEWCINLVHILGKWTSVKSPGSEQTIVGSNPTFPPYESNNYVTPCTCQEKVEVSIY